MCCGIKDIGHIRVLGKIADALGADHLPGPVLDDEVVELVYIEGRAAVIDECAYTVFLGLALLMVMVVMMMVMFMSAGLRLLFFRGNGFNAPHPAGRCGHLVEAEHPGIEYQAQVYLSVITLNDAGGGLDCSDDVADAGPLVRRDLRSLVEQNYVAELYLLED